MKLRSYQNELVDLSFSDKNLLIQADTGAGKTPVLAKIAKLNDNIICIAHRTILVKQLSRMLASFEISHNVIAAKRTVRNCILEHRDLGFGDTMLNIASNKHVASIDSLISRYRRGVLNVDLSARWVIIVDECHHMLDDNKWGKLRYIFPNCRVIGATATPYRLDGNPLCSSRGGVFDDLIQAKSLKKNSVRKLIDKGYLSDFKAYSIPELINHNGLKIGKYDYTYKSLESETRNVIFEMVGDAVKHYKKLANNKQALAFCVSIQIAEKVAEEFRNAGVPSAAIHSKLSGTECHRVFDLFEQREIKVLVNVDMIGEGVDVPAIEALIMLRKTASLGLYRQWVGRSLRPEEKKEHAILIDHVGNIRTHGMPDDHIEWDLKKPPSSKKSNLTPCPSCSFLVKAWVNECPECGEDLSRAEDSKSDSDIRYIDFNLTELKKKEIDKNVKSKAREQDLRENLQINNLRSSNMGALSKSVHSLKIWASNVMSNSGVSIYDQNCFFETEKHNEFWIKNFTFMDIKNNKSEKALGVYRKWLKYQ